MDGRGELEDGAQRGLEAAHVPNARRLPGVQREVEYAEYAEQVEQAEQAQRIRLRAHPAKQRRAAASAR